MQFDEEPDYNYLINLMMKVFTDNDFDDNSIEMEPIEK
jgi:hypothetical protein